MSRINSISIKNYRCIKELYQDFDTERFVVLIGRGDSGKSTILSAIYSVLCPSWNLSFSDLDFYKQNTAQPIEIEAEVSEIPNELLKDSKFGFFAVNDPHSVSDISELRLKICLTVENDLEPHWFVKARPESSLSDIPISAKDRGLLSVNYISDLTDNQFSYNKQSPLYALTKSKLDDNETIEQVKSNLLRQMTQSVKDEDLLVLKKALPDLTITAESLGLTIESLTAQLDIKENPYTGNSIVLHENGLPFRLHGKGNKRLMSMALQIEVASHGGVVLIDEIEQGLEPDRITTLCRLLKEIDKGQVFITTHSLNVILEAKANNLFIVKQEASSLQLVPSELDRCRRSNPQAFFAKKIICCEGKTEVGYLRAVDEWMLKTHKVSFSTFGVVLIDCGGGDKMYSFAKALKRIGYDTCVFADNDDSSLYSTQKEMGSISVPLLLCSKGNCLEYQIFLDLPKTELKTIIDCNQEEFPYANISVSDNLKKQICALTDNSNTDKIVSTLVELAVKTKHKEWFKHIPGGEFLGRTVMNCFAQIKEETATKKNINMLITWCKQQIGQNS